MTWDMIHCYFPTFENEQEVKEYMEEKRVAQAKRVAERERIIITEQRDDAWIATLVDDWRQGIGTTEEGAIGDLWLMYSHEIIERMKR